MADRREEAVAGVTLAQYAILWAGREDGLPLPDILSLAEVRPEIWTRAEDAWGARLLDDLDGDGPLAEELVALVAEARTLWERPLPPVDTELCAWLDFERAWAQAVDEHAFLAAFGMRAADVARLQEHWAAVAARDPSVQREMVRILAEEPGKPLRPTPGPMRIVGRPHGRTA
jgi:hypothetical protein